MEFKKFCELFLEKFREDHRSDFIWEALSDMSFPWEDPTWVGIDYLESIGADSNCVICYQELREMCARGTPFPLIIF